jgi:hypothetical protein
LKKDASEEECLKLQKIAHCKTRLDVHHFEQTADTNVFNITKIPELKFPKQTTIPVDSNDAFSKALKMDETDKETCGAEPDSSLYERINPEMLVTVLEILCRMSHGVAIDPASGLILE